MADTATIDRVRLERMLRDERERFAATAVTDIDGHTYVDFALGDSGAMAGHSPEPVVAAVRRRIEQRRRRRRLATRSCSPTRSPR